MDPELEAVRAQTDPLEQARMATELLQAYAQRSLELSRLRRSAVQRVRREKRMPDVQIARALGLTRGRLSQIMQAGGSS